MHISNEVVMISRSRCTALCLAPLAVLLFANAAAAQTGLVAAYGFNETSGTTAADASGNGHSGTLNGATWNAAGRFGGALSFNGSSNWVTVANSALLNLTTGMTLEAWVNVSSSAAWRTVMMKEHTSGLSYALYASDTASHPSAWIRRTGDVDATATSTLAANTWVHLAATYNNATLVVYVNGVQSGSRAVTGTITTAALPLRIGGNASWGEYFSGRIDEVRIYNRALTASEIQADMATPVAPPSPTWNITGTISPPSAGGGASVSLVGAASGSVTADANGSYSFSGLANGAYTVTPARAGYTFTPANRSVTIGGSSATGVDFSGSPVAPGGDTTPPNVSVTGPTGSVYGTVAVTATASDAVGVVGVRFRLDNVSDIGVEDTTSPYSVDWSTEGLPDGPHTLTAIARDAAGNVRTSSPVSVTLQNAANPAYVGQWATPTELGLVAVNMVLMHTGKILMYSGTFATSAVERVWDPNTGAMTLVPNPYFNLFCSGHSQLADGRILIVGGYHSGTLGAPDANIFDPITQSWTQLPNMAYRRWYPTATTLPDGKVLVTSGAQTCLTCLADVPELFDPVTSRFTTLPSARLGVPYYPFMYVLPDGRVLDAGANEDATETRVLNPSTWTWSMVDPVIHDGHSSVMYRPGKVLKTGTAADSGTAGTAAATAYVIDMTQPSPAWRQVPSMAFPRAFQNTTLLPDGTVLVTGGGTMLDGYNVGNAVKSAELWSPATETWRTLTPAALPRLYHSTALLLPDGRVLTAGSGNDGPAVNQTQAEFYSPPYLFKGPRPTITGAPTTIQYGQPFTVQTPDAASIASIALIRPGAVTHSFDEDQRFLNLAFTAGAASLTVQAPANANLAPPGYYMLFLVNAAGVPSIAPFVHFPVATGDTTPPTAPSGLSGTGGLGSASLTWTGSTDNTGVVNYNVHRSTVPGFAPSAANRVGQPAGTNFTQTALAAGAYYYVVTAQDLAGNLSAPSNEATVVVTADTTAPSVAFTAPADLSTVSGTIQVSAAATDDVGVAGVQFRLDGSALGSEDTAAPYSVPWTTTGATNGTHQLTATARDAAGNTSAVATITVTVSNAAPPPPTGLVAAYNFNEGTGTTAADKSGKGNTGTIAATWTAAGRYGQALSFDGASNRVNIADSSTLDLTNGMTLEAWVKPTALGAWNTIILKEATGDLAYSLYGESSKPSVYVNTGGAAVGVSGSSALPVNTWTHVAATFDGTTMRVFVNGAQVASKARSGNLAVTTGALRIGGNAVWGEYFQGVIDEVRIYNRALSAAEIAADMGQAIQ